MRDQFRKFKSRGFSLVELMIALVIGLLVLLGASQLFIISKRSYDRVEMLSDRQQALRAVFDFLSTDIRTAAEVVTVGGNELELAYHGSRVNDPYCGGSSSLYGVRYTYSDGSILVSVDCGSGFSAPPDPLFSGLSTAPVFISEEESHVEVKVSFNPMSDEPEGNEAFSFVVALRCKAFDNCATGG